MKIQTINPSRESFTQEYYAPNDLSWRKVPTWEVARPDICVVCNGAGINNTRSKVFICSDACRLERSNRARRKYNNRQKRKGKV